MLFLKQHTSASSSQCTEEFNNHKLTSPWSTVSELDTSKTFHFRRYPFGSNGLRWDRSAIYHMGIPRLHHILFKSWLCFWRAGAFVTLPIVWRRLDGMNALGRVCGIKGGGCAADAEEPAVQHRARPHRGGPPAGPVALQEGGALLPAAHCRRRLRRRLHPRLRRAGAVPPQVLCFHQNCS